MAFDANQSIPRGANIKVVGVGGGGSNAVNTMIRSGLDGVDFVTVNTDIQALRFALPEKKIQIGKELTKGLGAGADPDVGRDAALEDRHQLLEALSGADMVFITAGMGGGTGTGGASVVAQLAREQGALTVAVVTKPFNFEGKRRRRHAEMGIERLRDSVDTLITIPNQRLLNIATPDLSMIDAFRMADEVLLNAVKGISDIINIPGTVNVDFADVKTIMSSMGMALMGIGKASGENRAVEAAKHAICSPLLEDVNIEGATGILINITAGSSVSLMEVNEACSIIQDAAHEEANIIFGAVIDDTVGDEMRVTVIATGFPAEFEEIDQGSSLVQPKKSSFASGVVQTRTHQSSYSQKLNAPKPQVEQRKAGASAFEGWPKEPAKVATPIAKSAVQKPVAKEPAVDQETQSSMMAEDLTRMTMFGAEDKTTLENDINLSELHEEPAPVAAAPVAPAPQAQIQESAQKSGAELAKEVAPVIATAALASAAAAEFDQEAEELASEDTFGASTSEEQASPLSAFSDETDLVEEVTPSLEGASAEENAPLDSMFEKAESEEGLNFEFDQKLDDALELAERLKQTENTGDELDIPAFLRDGMKDLSLD